MLLEYSHLITVLFGCVLFKLCDAIQDHEKDLYFEVLEPCMYSHSYISIETSV